ncbi:hypothetical protein [Parazoarcus communis]|uniref:Uncharacterized protein n=1 Tax=Parazoarcus communis SWub3 = DSM 12120 TaxID=1121029 RepID=A0A323UUD8_9RHOO|nr:hypothetical protein [Parazoarcus communis]PZA16139.1 hypothetical protein DNK49_12500 [Azoarcus communis] [Parazoarcus communis SWub3 = DSM 12120]
MKIDQLPIGARFQWKGRNYTKVGPMTAASDSGGTDFVPKHAILQPVPGEAPPAPPTNDTPQQLDAAKVRAAFETYHRSALRLADDAGRLALETARQRFLTEIR